MHYLNLAAALAGDRRRQCPCGAVAEQPHGLCRKWHAYMVWRRKTTRATRHAARRQAAGHGARLLAVAMSLLRTTSKGVES
jgi:hypothetical protein